MFPRKYNKQNKFKRLLLKLLNVYAYERETLNIVNPNYKNNYGNKFNLFKYCFYFLITSFTIHSSYGLGYAKGLLKILNSSKLPKYLEISR